MKKMADFDKESFKKDVINNVKNLFRKTIDEATQEQVFQAVSSAVKDHIIDRWIATQKAYEEKNAKTVYYLSMEFLMGRALGNNMINLTCYEQVKEALLVSPISSSRISCKVIKPITSAGTEASSR